jgi:hypothetical protein
VVIFLIYRAAKAELEDCLKSIAKCYLIVKISLFLNCSFDYQ